MSAPSTPIRRLLIANRGEIAVRVARVARERGIVPLGIYSEADAAAYHLRFMDDALCVGPAPATASYLDIDAVVAAGRTLRADAIHPGYGFLSERAGFAQAVADAGMCFVGPTPDAMRAMGSKIEAKRRVRERGVPVLPGYDGDDQSPARLHREAEAIGTPLLIKASAGGGGRGMRVVDDLATFDQALESAKREALAAFGDDAVLLERYLRNPRHVEIQIIADTHGNTLFLGERECSIQRRHQKVLEESPSPVLTPELRERMGRSAVAAAQAAGYTNAGTVEFMLDEDGRFYFLEMNARLQVEHPVTELAYGVDLVQLQIDVANGEPLALSQETIAPRGHAIEVRLYAEDPASGFLPASGTLVRWCMPEGPGIRVDAGVTQGDEVSIYYDPMLAKLIVWGSDRPAAIARLTAALDATEVAGVKTNVPFLRWLARDAWFHEGRTTTSFLSERLHPGQFTAGALPQRALAAAAALVLAERAPFRIAQMGIPVALRHDDGHIYRMLFDRNAAGWLAQGDLEGELAATQHGDALEVQFAGERFAVTGEADAEGVTFAVEGQTFALTFAPSPSVADPHQGGAGSEDGAQTLRAPMPGKILKVTAKTGERVEERTLLVVLEAMKMEHRIEAPGAANIAAVKVREGELVAAGAPLVELEPLGS
ncbi:ATP-grasp domain-containing protein [bacterium]|nr:MAG: ATP-grasp domain-containing protein [bacterium]